MSTTKVWEDGKIVEKPESFIAPVVTPQQTTNNKIEDAPDDLFGGPTLGEIFNGN